MYVGHIHGNGWFANNARNSIELWAELGEMFVCFERSDAHLNDLNEISKSVMTKSRQYAWLFKVEKVNVFSIKNYS